MAKLSSRARLARISDALRGSLWPIPAALIALGAAAAFGSLALDRNHFVSQSFGVSIFRAGPAGARATLSALATSLMSIAGISISVTMIVLQLASSQFSPRVVRSFLRDWLIQFVFGAYVGSFTFLLLVLRAIRSAGEDSVEFVAPFSVTIALLLGTSCVVLLVVLVNHVARSLRASAIVARIADETAAAIDEMYPCKLGAPAHADSAFAPASGDPVEVRATSAGYLAYTDADSFGPDLREVRIESSIGDFVRTGDVLARAWPAGSRAARGLGEAFVLTAERTMQQDVRLGFHLLGDVALRALSPGVNDPTTAIDCVNRVGELLCRLVLREFPPARRLHRGVAITAPSPSLAEIVRLGLRPIVVFGHADARVLHAVLDALFAIAARDSSGGAADVRRELCDAIARAASDARDWTAVERCELQARAAAGSGM